MSVPEKSSDEILKELFGMCLQSQTKSIDSSSDGEKSSVPSDQEIEKKHKHKKKKKKHKKNKKRKRSSSAESTTSQVSHNFKKEKSAKENEEPNNASISIKIKSEKMDDYVHENINIQNSDEIQAESQAPNYLDALTGQKLTMDDVFNSLGIITEETLPIKIKKEKDVQNPKEETTTDDITNKISKTLEKSNSPKIEKTSNISNDKLKISEVFSNNETNKSKYGPKKINIKNLKDSSVFKATLKEIEEQEKGKAELYEEGELSSSASESDTEILNDVSDKDIKLYDSSAEKNSQLSKHKKRSKSRDRNEKKRHSHKKKKHSKSSHEHLENVEMVESNGRSHRRVKSSSKHRHQRKYSRHRHHDGHRSSDTDLDGSTSKRSHNSRPRKHRPSRERSHSRSRSRRKSSRHRSKSKSPEKIDKQKLLEIARKNAINLLKQGALPASVIASKDKIATIKAGGKTVDELTDFCKQLSKKDNESRNSLKSESDVDSDDGKDRPFHHPFQIKERPSSIVMNIRNAVPLPTKTAQEKTLELSKQLSLQYPVSSGQQHRKTENEWVPVIREEESTSSQGSSKADSNALVCYPLKQTVTTVCKVNPPPVHSVAPTTGLQQKDIDIGNVVAQRLEAIRRLTENPQDPVGNNLIQTVDSKMQVWAESKVQPGLFTGSTGVRPLTVSELSSGCKAWPKKNQFVAAKPVQSDKGEALMKKMGWQPGEGLGKYKQGPAAPCEISLKTDRKGLAEQPPPPPPKVFTQPILVQKVFEIAQNKHPVSLLNEYCSRRKFPTPKYDCEEKEGAARRKLFLFSVTVQGVRYTPRMPSTNKKQSKVEAATACLQTLGLLPVINPAVS